MTERGPTNRSKTITSYPHARSPTIGSELSHRRPAIQPIYDPKDRLGLLRCEVDFVAANVVPRSQQRRVRARLDAVEVVFA